MGTGETREVLLTIRPGESVDEFTSRIADTAPPLTPELAATLRALLPVTTPPVAAPTAPAFQTARRAA
ncbi:hypothetical protein [Streptomyces sp. JB150]|jgi:hypothetical protein|uniref:hypothetical protein n=1 Tax=Streptomyces sp. JB150 TaxID=2714844 RepID=UPI0014081C4D|nr:hypothetical protein [Streptomyces sp. JB150]QIJ62608.1 hypothetical protein G7Z13_11575 [Streptomyces sp. JB150]